MTKTEFLRLLQGQICMLDDGEQKDILDEYAQHIDMKVESGMTEAEAIEDFGSMQELAAEILSAYHVKPMAAADSVSSEVEDLKESGHNLAAATISLTKKGCSRVGGFLARMMDKVKAAFKELVDWHPFRRKTGEGGVPLAAKGGSLLKDLKNGSISFGKFCWRLCLTVLRWCWNVFVVFVAVCIFACGLTALFCMGVCVVLALQGYPLGGVTLALLGSVLVCASLGMLSMKLLWIKGRMQSVITSNPGQTEPLY